MKKRNLLTAFAAGCMMLLATSCGTSEDSVVIYSEDAYNYEIVCSMQMGVDEATSISTLTDTLKDSCGSAPSLVYEADVKEPSKTAEILIGQLNRDECKIPKLEDQEAYWCVKKVGKDIVINGSTPSALKAAMDYFMTLCSYDKETSTFSVAGKLDEEHIMKGYFREGWLLTEIPSYWGGQELSAVYDCGTTVTDSARNEDKCLMQSALDTTEKEVADYVKLLEENGFKKISKNTMENNVFYRYTNDECKVSVNYFANEGVTDVIWDGSSIALNDVSYTYEPKEGERTEMYLYGLYRRYYDDSTKNDSIAIRGGLAMVIKCADNSVIVIDGGDSDIQLDYEKQAEFLDFLYEVTGQSKGEKIRISAWYITHGHGDHANGVAAFLTNFGSNVNLERLLVNLPDKDKVEVSDVVVNNIGKGVSSFKYAETKLHTGDVLQIADVKMEVIYTHEDLATKSAIWAGDGSADSSNDASTVIKLTTSDGMSLLMTGDMNYTTCAAIEKNFTTETLKSTLALIPHHLYNNIPESYFVATAPQYFLAGADVYNVNNNSTTKAQYAFGEKYSQGVYCEQDTYGFAFEDEKAVVIYHKEMFKG